MMIGNTVWAYSMMADQAEGQRAEWGRVAACIDTSSPTLHPSRSPMDFHTYFDGLIKREGDWLRPAKVALQLCWPPAAPGLDRVALQLYEEVFGKPSDEDLRGIDEWFYRANDGLDNHRPIDLVATAEGVLVVRALFMRTSAGLVG